MIDVGMDKPEIYDGFVLKMEIVPEPCWFFNLRKLFTASKWFEVRTRVYGEFLYTCPFCGSEHWDDRYPWEIPKAIGGGLHAHEIWRYDDEIHTQFLDGITAICPTCHSIKHMFLTQKRVEEGALKMEDIISHFCTVNKCMPQDFHQILKYEMLVYHERGKYQWLLDIGDYFEYLAPKSAEYIVDGKLEGNWDLLSDKTLSKIDSLMIERGMVDD